MPDLLKACGNDRQRIIAALEYFDEKGWIQLQSRKTVEVYDIISQTFDCDQLTHKMARLFQAREDHEIQRIHHMVDFLESKKCLSLGLAAYFGETLEMSACGHCSVCRQGPVSLEYTIERQPLSECHFLEYVKDYCAISETEPTARDLTKFLCGIMTPQATVIKAKSLSHFGKLEGYPFQEVAQWISRNLTHLNESTKNNICF